MKLSDCDCIGMRDEADEAGSVRQMALCLISPHPTVAKVTRRYGWLGLVLGAKRYGCQRVLPATSGVAVV